MNGTIILGYLAAYIAMGLLVSAITDTNGRGPDALTIVTWPVLVAVACVIACFSAIWYVGLVIGELLRTAINDIKHVFGESDNAN